MDVALLRHVVDRKSHQQQVVKEDKSRSNGELEPVLQADPAVLQNVWWTFVTTYPLITEDIWVLKGSKVDLMSTGHWFLITSPANWTVTFLLYAFISATS